MAKRKNNPKVLAERITILETNYSWIKLKLEKVDQRTWYILGGVIVTILLALAKIFI